jgi:3D (Asp-Asp-Asp) domain-containing protein
MTPSAAPADEAFRSFRLTSYQVIDEQDYPAGDVTVPVYAHDGSVLARVSPACFANLALEGSGRLDDGRFVDVSGDSLAVPPGDYAEVLAYHRRCLPSRPVAYSGLTLDDGGAIERAVTFCVVAGGALGKGYGIAHGIPLEPFRTLAADIGATLRADPRWKGKGGVVPPGTRVYIRELDGRALPGGAVHDGWFVVNDTGGGIFGAHFDVFVGSRALGRQVEIPSVAQVWFDGIETRVPPGYDYGLVDPATR